ncbi:MAG: methyltransferase family protein [Candidatus Jordarchaeum sp.]|uniref:methyltransferase family protein n=1 Tax=Candidatus Jordarchaeum sp. TaxID=2823881 RepID=UPI00404A7864
MGEESGSHQLLIINLLTTFVSILLIVAFILAWIYNPYYITYIQQIHLFSWMSWGYSISFELIRNIAWTNWLLNPARIEIIKYTAWTIWIYNVVVLELLYYIGYILWVVAVVFMLLPISVFHRKGGVPKGKGYYDTTVLVESGIYSVVRHPQYTGVAVLCLVPICLGLYWLLALIGIACMVICYWFTRLEDRSNVEKFGKAYESYMQSVPAMNFLVGVIRLLRH